jgi:hypothetical protein
MMTGAFSGAFLLRVVGLAVLLGAGLASWVSVALDKAFGFRVLGIVSTATMRTRRGQREGI